MTLKNVACDSDATALASMVFPLPGGPKRSKPRKKRVQKSQYLAFSYFNFHHDPIYSKMLRGPKELPLAGLRRPVNKSLLLVGKITISIKDCFAFSSPAAFPY